MSLISVNFNTQIRQVIIPCAVMRSGSFKNFKEKKNPSEQLPLRSYMALVDTGATATAISPKIVKELELDSHSLTQNFTAGGTVDAKLYDIDLVLNFVNHGVTIEKLSVIEIPVPEDNNFQMLLGMDVILRGHLSISFDGHFIFAI